MNSAVLILAQKIQQHYATIWLYVKGDTNPNERNNLQVMTFQTLQDRIVEWKKVSINSTLEGSIEHLIEEVVDLKKDPYDPLSLADCFILLMGISDEVGFSMDEMASAIVAKQTINEQREWEEADENGVIRWKKK